MREVRYARGFTLIELMIVVAIVAILAAIALPSYRAYVERADRLAAQQFMFDVANRAEEYRLDRREYPPDLDALNVAIPPDVSLRFTITLTPTPTPTFTVTATPTASAPGQVVMTLLGTGARAPADRW